jgi:hypothetical protein
VGRCLILHRNASQLQNFVSKIKSKPILLKSLSLQSFFSLFGIILYLTFAIKIRYFTSLKTQKLQNWWDISQVWRLKNYRIDGILNAFLYNRETYLACVWKIRCTQPNEVWKSRRFKMHNAASLYSLIWLELASYDVTLLCIWWTVCPWRRCMCALQPGLHFSIQVVTYASMFKFGGDCITGSWKAKIMRRDFCFYVLVWSNLKLCFSWIRC